MSSSTCSARDATSYECHWNYDHGVKSDLTAKANVGKRRKREFTPDELKDDNYWMKRSRNNEAARRSRERRRMEERLLEERALQLLRENEKLKAALSAINYPGVGNETYDSFMDYSPVRQLSQASYVRTMLDLPGANYTSYYAPDIRYYSSTYDSVPLQRMQRFPAAPFDSLDKKHQRDRYMGINTLGNGNVTSSSYCSFHENAQRKWGHAHIDVMNLRPNAEGISLNEMVPGYQCPAGSLPNCAAHIRMNESYLEQRSFATEPKNCSNEIETIKKPQRVVTSPLLPHKLRYKVRKALRGGGISQDLQE